MRIRSVIAGLVLFALGQTGGAPRLLENEWVRIELSKGAIARLEHKRAIRFPFIEQRGAGVAASGRLFAPVLRLDGREIEPALEAVGNGSTLRGEFADKLVWNRTLRLRGALLEIEDAVRNKGTEPVKIQLGSRSDQERADWNLAQRSRVEQDGGKTAWRVIGQYGTGFVYRLLAEGEPENSRDRFAFWTKTKTLRPGETHSLRSEAFVVEGSSGRRENVLTSVLVDADLAEAGTRGEKLRGFASVAAPESMRVRLVVKQLGDSDETIAAETLTVTPGRTRTVPYALVPRRQGMLRVEVAAHSEDGRLLSSAQAEAAIEHPGPSFDLYSRRMPQEIYRGTWNEIGRQLVTKKQVGSPTSLKLDKPHTADPNLFAVYERKLPFWAELLRGAAQALDIQPATLARFSPPGSLGDACMNIAFYGTDGPINAFSKERSGLGLNGLGYQKVVPSKGYPFHVYMGYGINSEGLSTSGATLNEDKATGARGAELARQRRAAGNPIMPKAALMWMLLATCKNVEEAVALLESAELPADWTGSMLLLDRAGNTARLESSGLLKSVSRPRAGEKAFFAAGNYAHKRADGMFDIGDNWGWAANTMLRERALWRLAGEQPRNVSLDRVFTLMQTHGPGGMCQHLDDNPARLYSSCSYIAVTRTSELWLAHGPPCQVRYQRFAHDN